MSLDFEIVNIILIILNIYNLATNHSHFLIKESDIRKIKDIFYVNSL